MQVRVLGALEVVADQGRTVGVGGPRVRALLVRLALEAGRAVRGETLVAALWGHPDAAGAPGDQANALQSLVSRLRRALPDPGLVVSEGGGYRLAIDPDAVDAARFERLARQGRRALDDGDATRAAGALREALALWRGPALADAADAPFAAAPAARLDELRLAAREDLCEAELSRAAGRRGAAGVLPELEALAAEQPLRERPLALLMRARYAAGRPAEALAAYQDYRARLAEELGVDPSPGLAELHLAVLRGEVRPAAGEPAPDEPAGEAPPAPPPPGNLRAALTSFVGREEELRLIGKRLAEGRLVTLVGPGGSGKTRLANTAAADLVGHYPGGVWLVELASVGDPDDVPRAVLGALGRRVTGLLDRPRQPGGPGTSTPDTLGRLVEELPDSPTLLLLDNCEHLVTAAARLADQLLGARPRLRVLATSREPLGILGEALCPVPPLALPDAAAGSVPTTATPDTAGAATDTAVAAALAAPAVRLFADRAGAARPGFAVTEANVAAAVEICRRLDGLPLAIELAAARLRTLTPAQLAARLDDRFRLLTGGNRTALPRHQTLRAVVAWSWELLTDAERRLAERLAVFAGGVTPSAAEGVTGVDAGTALDLLASLADRSLLQPVWDDEAGTGDEAAGEPRFRMLETLREYGWERLAEQGLSRAVRDAHAGYFLALAETAEPHLRGRGQLRWIDRLIAERDNLLAALHHAAGSGDAATAVRLAAALGQFWTIQGDHEEAAGWLRTAIDVPGEAPGEARLRAMSYYLLNRGAAGDPSEFGPIVAAVTREIAEQRTAERDRLHPVLAVIEPGLAVFSERPDRGLTATERALSHPDPWTRAMLRLMRGALLENNGDPAAQAVELEQAATGFREVGDRWGLSMTLTSLGDLYRRRGELGRARDALEEARRLMDALRTEPDSNNLRIRLAVIRAQQGEAEDARAELLRLAERAERQSAGYLAAFAHLALGDLLRWADRPAEAATHYAAALVHVERRAFAQPQLNALLRTSASLLEPEPDAAARLLDRALSEALDVDDMPVVAAVGVGIAALCVERADASADPSAGREAAAVALGAAAAVRGMPEVGPDIDRLTARLRDGLGEAGYAAAYRGGADLDRPAAIAELRLRLAPVRPDGEREEHREERD